MVYGYIRDTKISSKEMGAVFRDMVTGSSATPASLTAAFQTSSAAPQALAIAADTGSALSRVMGKDYAPVGNAVRTAQNVDTSAIQFSTANASERVSIGQFKDAQATLSGHTQQLQNARNVLASAVEDVQRDIMVALGDDGPAVMAAIQRNFADDARATAFGGSVDVLTGGVATAVTLAYDLHTQAKGLSAEQAKALLADLHQRMIENAKAPKEKGQDVDHKPVVEANPLNPEAKFDYTTITTDEFFELAAGTTREEDILDDVEAKLHKVEVNHQHVAYEQPELTASSAVEPVLDEPDNIETQDAGFDGYSYLYHIETSGTLLDIKSDPEAMEIAAVNAEKMQSDVRNIKATLHQEPDPSFYQDPKTKVSVYNGMGSPV